MGKWSVAIADDNERMIGICCDFCNRPGENH